MLCAGPSLRATASGRTGWLPLTTGSRGRPSGTQRTRPGPAMRGWRQTTHSIAPWFRAATAHGWCGYGTCCSRKASDTGGCPCRWREVIATLRGNTGISWQPLWRAMPTAPWLCWLLTWNAPAQSCWMPGYAPAPTGELTAACPTPRRNRQDDGSPSRACPSASACRRTIIVMAGRQGRRRVSVRAATLSVR